MTANQESKTDQDVERFLIRTIQKRFYQSVPCSEVIDLIQQNYEFLWDPASQLSPDSDNTSIMKYFPSIELYPDESTGRLYCRLAPSSSSTVDNNGNKDFFGNKENHQASVSRVFCLAYVEETILQFIDTQPNKCIAYSVLPTFYNQKWGSFKKTGRKLGYKKFEKMITSFRSMETFTKNKRTMLSRRRSENMSLVPKSIDCGSRLPKKRRRRSGTTLLVDASRNMEHASKGAYTNMSPSKLSPKSISSVLVDTYEMLEELSHQAPFQVSCASKSTCNGETVHKDIVAMDCIGDPQDLYLIQVATENTVYMLDCVALDSISVYQLIRDMLLNQSVLKLFHDVYNSAAVFAALGGVDDLPQGTLDTQVLMESMTGQCHSGLLEMLEHFGIYPQSKSLADRATMDSKLFALRPIPPKLVQHYVDKVRFLLDIPSKILLSSESTLNKYMRISDARVQSAAQSGGVRHVVFDKDNSYKLASYEVLHDTRPTGIALQRNLVVSEDIDSLLCLLKSDLSNTIAGQTDDLSDIVLDKGRRAVCWIKGKRVVLASEDRIVDDADIDHVVTTVGDFGNDNRAGIERQLHRISAVRNRKNEIVGLTLRVGRHIVGNADIIRDLLFQDTSASILFLGEPGSGKTTVVREVTKLLADEFNVSIVDTSNEIAGDGDIPHPCVGHARRMMVPSLDQQSKVMIECVQNHTPAVLVIDEIGRPTEVEAARTCKHRGVRLIASAHGDLRGLVKNPKLRGLVGDVKQVTLGDAQAKKNMPHGKFQKVKTERAGPPTFDIIVELDRDKPNHWRIITNVGQAVDAILDGTAYHVQRRIRNPESGTIQLKHETI